MTHRELAEMIFKNKSIMNGYEPFASDDELIDYYAILIKEHCTRFLINPKITMTQEQAEKLNGAFATARPTETIKQVPLTEEQLMEKIEMDTTELIRSNGYLQAIIDVMKLPEIEHAMNSIEIRQAVHSLHAKWLNRYKDEQR